MNELTFAGWLAEFTATRAQRRQEAGEPVLIASGAIEERQVDADGRVRRCDLRFNSVSGRKLASGELKRPEVAEGRAFEVGQLLTWFKAGRLFGAVEPNKGWRRALVCLLRSLIIRSSITVYA
jgi:hypothetical protein